MGRSATKIGTAYPARLRTGALALPLFLSALAAAPFATGQTATTSNALPRVVIPTSNRPTAPLVRPGNQAQGILYPWRLNITATVFWIGEAPSQNNPTPNNKSSWDQQWSENFGGYDNPEPSARIAGGGDYRPKGFTPRLNPFYIALPYNDVVSSSAHKPEASKVIPWFARMNPDPGKTVLKGRWVQIFNGKTSCYAQWEDCGPWMTDDWEYVFQGKAPKNHSNQDAGIDISPAIRDFLDLQSGQKCHWRFVEAGQVPYGPWKKYGQDVARANSAQADAQQTYMEYLRRVRDEEYQRKTKSQLENGH
ncbi:hypothetical protein [Haloferula sp. BvORR071]|uniref:hypothetical protein n=1 Tax=Haloferula sp. BvORR071 TaxID=1396141 RepID=UPI002240F0D8|nr:hypothetical protein [Haloferula sp. BvORR071]